MKLMYGGPSGTAKEAIPDFIVLDVVSFLRMAVVEDKRFNDEMKNSEPQLIAELIALFQANAGDKAKNSGVNVAKKVKKEEDEKAAPIIGVRVNGLSFWFYLIENPDNLLLAMDTCLSASEKTTIKKLGGDIGLNFLHPHDRSIIIQTFDTFRLQFCDAGSYANRRDSFSADHKA
jgi:hypothetical protein